MDFFVKAPTGITATLPSQEQFIGTRIIRTYRANQGVTTAHSTILGTTSALTIAQAVPILYISVNVTLETKTAFDLLQYQF